MLRKASEVTRSFLFQRERVLKRRMKEKKRAKQKMTNAEQKVRVVTAFRGNKDNDLELQVGDEVTVLLKVRASYSKHPHKRTCDFLFQGDAFLVCGR